MSEQLNEGIVPDSAPVDTGLEAFFIQALEKREAKRVEETKRAIARLAEPDTTRLEQIHGGGEKPATREATVVSRNQPTDPLYRRLYERSPSMREFRTPDLDHWGAVWLMALARKDLVSMRVAADKLNGLTRASTLEGTLDASDPTAILGGTGGHLLPQNLANVVMVARDKVAVIPSLAQNYTMTSKTLRIPTAGAMTAAMAAEGATAAQGEPTFATVLLDAEKAQVYAVASIEMIADSAFNLISVYSERAGAALGALADVEICTAGGTTPHISELIAGGDVSEATPTVLIYEDLVTLFFALTQPYRANAVWLGNSVTLALLSKLMDGNDRPVLSFPTQQVAPVTNTPGAIGSVYGKPVYEVPLANGQLIFGDVQQGYAFGRRSGIMAAVSEHVLFATDLVAFKFTERFDGRIVDAVAMKQMAGLATVA